MEAFRFQGEDIGYREIERKLRDYATLSTRDPEKAPRLCAQVMTALNAALTRILELEWALQSCREFVDGYVDVVDGDYGEPAPNKSMRLASEIDEVLPRQPA